LIGSHCGAFELDVGAVEEEADLGSAVAPEPGLGDGESVDVVPRVDGCIGRRWGGFRRFVNLDVAMLVAR